MAVFRKLSRFRGNYSGDKFCTGGRKQDSNYHRIILGNKKITVLTHLLANVDQMLIVLSMLHPRIKLGLIDRFLVMAESENLQSKIILTKIDLLEKYPQDVTHTHFEIQKIYQNLGYSVVPVVLLQETDSLKEMLKTLSTWLTKKRTIIVGHSGVGKTTLLNKVDPKYMQKTQEVSQSTFQGKHTTTRVRLHSLYFGGEIFDMPGLKEVTQVNITKRELGNYFLDIRKYARNCFFSNCIHDSEKNCAVKDAVLHEKIHPLRFSSYNNILQELKG